MGLASDRDHTVTLNPHEVDDNVVEALKAEIAKQSDLSVGEIDLVNTVVLDVHRHLDNHAKVSLTDTAD